MKILLIVPTHHYTEVYPVLLSVSDFPQGYAYLAASLKKAGHEVVGLNLNNITGYPSAYEMIANQIHKALETEKPDLIGIGGLCVDYSFIKDAIQVIRMFSKTPIVLGGGIINNDAEFVFNLLKPDYAVVGEGEEGIVRIASGKAIKGIIHSQEYKNLDELPFPDYEPFGIQEMLDKYSQATRLLYRYSRTHPRPMIISTARSCPFNCSFCVHNHGTKYRVRSIENIMAEIREMYDKYKFNILITQDELFAVNKKRMREFCTALIENKKKYGWDFNWMFQTHANAKLDIETMKLAKESGCYLFSYGLESASPTVLKSMNKRTKIPQIIDAISIAKAVDIGFAGNLIFGDPVETESTIYETLDFYAKYCQDESIFIASLMPYPGSKVFDYCIEKGIIKDKLDYYENINKKTYNMTSIPDETWSGWTHFLFTLEKLWLWSKSTIATRWEKEETDDAVVLQYNMPMCRIWAKCPHCDKEMIYRLPFPEITNDDTRKFMGTACPSCNRRVRVDIKAIQ